MSNLFSIISTSQKVPASKATSVLCVARAKPATLVARTTNALNARILAPILLFLFSLH